LTILPRHSTAKNYIEYLINDVLVSPSGMGETPRLEGEGGFTSSKQPTIYTYLTISP
jgi:hypothetical protein